MGLLVKGTALKVVSIAESFTTFGKNVIRFELHIFANASMLGYGAVAYVKPVYCGNSAQCCFVFGKSRVEPLKPVNAPRLKLTAAIFAPKISQCVIRE